MKTQKIVGLWIAALVLVSGLVFVQCSDGTDVSRQQARMKFERVDRETPEMIAKRAEFYQKGLERLNKAVAEGKMEQARADYLTKWMANDKAFKDANPEWTKYLFAGKKFGDKKDGKKDGKKFDAERVKKDGVKKEARAKADCPKMDPTEIKANWEKNYQARIDKFNAKVSEGKIDSARAAFMQKFMENDKAFKDANPEWAEYGFFGKMFNAKHGKKEGAKAKK